MRVTITLIDPWDMGEVLGWPVFRGVLQRTESTERGGRALIKLDQPVDHDGAPWCYLVAAPRHEDGRIADLQNGKEIVAACTGISEQQALSKNPMDTSSWRGGGLAFVADLAPSIWVQG